VLNAGRRSRGGWRNALLSALWPGGAALREWAREINHKVVNLESLAWVLAFLKMMVLYRWRGDQFQVG
jgi:hypothetical protein